MNPTRVSSPLRLAISLVLLSSVCLSAQATESGVDNIGPGTDGFFMLPLDVNNLADNMVAFNLYYNFYKARKLNISSLGGKVPGVEITSEAVIPRLDYLTPLRLAGGRLGFYAAQPGSSSACRPTAWRMIAKAWATPPWHQSFVGHGEKPDFGCGSGDHPSYR